MGVIYALCEPGTGRIRYVGQTRKPPLDRFRGHVGSAFNRNCNTRLAAWLRSLDQEPIMVVLATIDNDELDKFEKRWIRSLRRDGYDLCNKS